MSGTPSRLLFNLSIDPLSAQVRLKAGPINRCSYINKTFLWTDESTVLQAGSVNALSAKFLAEKQL